LKQEYLLFNGKGGESAKEKAELREDCIRRLLRRHRFLMVAFSIAIVDKAHFLKNRVTYWTMAIGLASMHSSRVVPLTETPSNNGHIKYSE
jgi:hypothetical protein